MCTMFQVLHKEKNEDTIPLFMNAKFLAFKHFILQNKLLSYAELMHEVSTASAPINIHNLLTETSSAEGRVSREPRKPFRARKAIFGSAVSKNVEVYTPETSCIKKTSVHIKNM